MSKTFLYRFFGIGGIPTNVRAEIEREGVVLFDEGIRGTVTYINFRAPGATATGSGNGSRPR
ncbi:MAG: hypothetical protein WKF92_11275 [Pyrinomonadaceae bacterium]